MILWLIHWFSSKLQARVIDREDGKPYLTRYRILGWMPGSKRKWPISIYLHHFHEADLDEACHSHPWAWSFSLLLQGGYVEELLFDCGCGVRYAKIESRNVVAPSVNLVGRKFHRAAKLIGKETWTLFIAGPKTSSWGFYVLGRGFVPWRDRLRERGVEVPMINDSI